MAYTFRFSLAELDALDTEELMEWHRQATRIHKRLNPET